MRDWKRNGADHTGERTGAGQIDGGKVSGAKTCILHKHMLSQLQRLFLFRLKVRLNG